MSSTDREKEMIKEWAVSKDSRICVDRESFWEDYECSGDIAEYDFQTVPELKKVLGEALVGCEDVILPLTVAAFKKKDQGRTQVAEDVKDKAGKDDFSIPEFIYVF